MPIISRNIFNPLIRLLFPPHCPSCGREPVMPLFCCLHCLYELEPTNFHVTPTRNPTYFRLSESEVVQMASSGFYYEKGSTLQKLIFKLKYHRLPQLGVTLGKYYANQLQGSNIVADAEAIVPIPLHKKKLRKKGYNHAERIAFGLSQTLKIKLDDDILIRDTFTGSQTLLDADQRKKNVHNAFKVTSPERYNSIILVDDVMTTGATVLSACRTLEEAGIKNIKVITIGIARNG